MFDPVPSLSSADSDLLLLDAMIGVAQNAGSRLLAAFSTDARPDSREALIAGVAANEDRVADGLQRALMALRPQARWLTNEVESAPLPDGEWWVVDAVEGNVNHVHGLRDWGVSLTLMREQRPVAAVVHQPLEALTWTAVRGGGARCNGAAIHVSAKSRLDAAIATTGQAEAQQVQTYGPIGASITHMLHHALLVRMTVPSTFPMMQLARGQNDVFWQYCPVLPGVAAGWLIVTEAGGVVSRIDGTPWATGAPDILMTAPHLHAAAVHALNGHEQVELA
ncbi:inositol monophosphatase family protein [Roseateles amylovorans]|uniref:3'(2'),5'-bisphosphate nucleotidase CysQ n=1 Tax=Roseateles amylovorans TaxID=2978473 RepID=A0ABY6B1I8_9BURK|nr:inositol monophosphatase family protein [Roseateles amylovorans]UXH79077.1 3'(2'),5'-bisphosphate nucleotidase CysQ [Roseateles amylovorans]